MPTKSFRLHPRHDLDILSWLNEQSSASNTIKRALRREMGVPIHDLLPEHARDVLGDLVNEIRQMRKQISSGVVMSGNGDGIEESDDSEFDEVLGRIGT